MQARMNRTVRMARGFMVLAVFMTGVAVAAHASDKWETNQAGIWVPPAGWTELGAVQDWRDTDTRFYRSQEDAQFLDESQNNVDQAGQYARTREYRGGYDGVDIAVWPTLSPVERDARTAAAGKELRYLTDFRRRLLNYVQNTRMGQTSGWGAEVSDHVVVGTALGKLRTAVALDPSNAAAWHLYSYFATLAGDVNRALAAIAGAEAALAAIDTKAVPELRAGVALDKAWLLRETGQFADARRSLEEAAAHGAVGDEPKLLQGLLAAQSGDDMTAIAMAIDLRGTEVAKFPTNYRDAGFGPELSNTEAWTRKPSSYLHDWILACTWLREGKVDLARAAFGTYCINDQRPFAHRFWNEAGQIYELTGRPAAALAAWNQARVCVPYYPFLVYKTGTENLGRLTGRPGAVPYLLGFDTNYLSGSRLAWAAALVTAVAESTDDHQRTVLASRALDQLEICERLGWYRGQALILRGQVFYLMGDVPSALAAVQQALGHLDAVGDRAGFAAVTAGLAQSGDALATQDIANFYGQSGASAGRWRVADDPQAELAGLRAAFESDPTDANRRALARFLVRNGEVSAGRELALVPLQGAAETAGAIARLDAADVVLVLEADRASGQTALAVAMVQTLAGGGTDPWDSAEVWTLAGFICLDSNLTDAGRRALERAAVLDPGNQGLKLQLSMM